MSAEALIYTLRPDRTTLWLPPTMAKRFGVKRGGQLTEAQMNDAELQDLFAARIKEQNERGRKGGMDE